MKFKLAGLILSCLITSVLVLSSCSASPTSQVTSGATPVAARPSGSLTVALAFGAGHPDPLISSASGFKTLSAFIFDTLMYVGPDNKLKPGIAERYEIAQDGMSQTYFIRKGVKFHDGSDLTGADVKFSIERNMSPEQTLHMDATSWRASVAKVELKDDYTVVVYMKQPLFELLKGELAGGMAAIVPKKYIEEKGVEVFRKNLIGSGPWRFVRYEAGSSLELEAVESHWRNVPKFKNLKVVNVAEEASKIAMLKTGELDMADIAPDSVAQTKAAGLGLFTYDGDSQYVGWLLWDKLQPEKYILGDLRVRKALQFAVNSQEMISSMFGGKGRLFALTYVSPAAYFFDSNVLKPAPYDPEQSKKLLAEAGYANGFKLKIWDTKRGIMTTQVAEAVSGYLRKVGISPEIATMEYSAFYAQVSPNPKPEVYDTFWLHHTSAQREFEGVSIGYHSTKGVLKNINLPALDQMIDKVPVTIDLVQKKKLALDAAELAWNQYSGVRILSPDINVAISAKIGQVTQYRDPTFAYTYETITHAK